MVNAVKTNKPAPLTVRDLRVVGLLGKKNLVVYCPVCGSEYSADPNDYWMADDTTKFRCGCGAGCILAERVVLYNKFETLTARKEARIG